MDDEYCFFLDSNDKKNVEIVTTKSDSNEQLNVNWQRWYMEYDSLHRNSKGESQIIALIDSGISGFQIQKVKKYFDLTDEKSGIDNNGHGTMMCSLILGDNELLGIAPEALIYSYKVVGSSGKVEPQILAKAINQAINDKVTIINISLGSYFDNAEIQKAIKDAYQAGIVLVAASGDYETSDMLYPARYNECISVGAIDKDNKIWEGTNAEKDCDILAPGVDINTTLNTGEMSITTGTSQSTALISGYIALIKDYALNNGCELHQEDIKKILHKIKDNKLSYSGGINMMKDSMD